MSEQGKDSERNCRDARAMTMAPAGSCMGSVDKLSVSQFTLSARCKERNRRNSPLARLKTPIRDSPSETTTHQPPDNLCTRRRREQAESVDEKVVPAASGDS